MRYSIDKLKEENVGFVKNLIYRLRGDVTTETLIKRGMKVGKNFSRENNVHIDPGHCWLIGMGDNVTLAPNVMILAHDASTFKTLRCTKIGRVDIGNNVFVGARSVILPGVRIGDNVIIGANSTVTKDIPSNSVAVGAPAKVIGSIDEKIDRTKQMLAEYPCYGKEYTMKYIDETRKEKQREDLKVSRIGFLK